MKACRYPTTGARGCGPRRRTRYGGVVIRHALRMGTYLGMAGAFDAQMVRTWIEKGFPWLNLNEDYGNLYRHSALVLDEVRRMGMPPRRREED